MACYIGAYAPHARPWLRPAPAGAAAAADCRSAAPLSPPCHDAPLAYSPDLQHTEAELSAEDMSEKRRYAPANAPSVGYAILLIPRARVPIASLMCCCNAGERSSELLYVLKMRQRSSATSRI